MTDLLLFLFLVWGGVYVVTESAILAAPRILLAARSHWLEGLLYCPWCVSFWVGMSAWSLFYVPMWAPLGGLIAMGSIVIPQGLGVRLSAYAYEHPLVQARRSRA